MNPVLKYVSFSGALVLGLVAPLNVLAAPQNSTNVKPMADAFLVQAPFEKSVLNVDIRDVAENLNDKVPQAKVLAEEFRTNFAQYFGAKLEKIFGVELTEVTNAGGVVTLKLLALYSNKAQSGQGRQFYFRKFVSTFTGTTMNSLRQEGDDISMADTHFSIQVGLFQRKLILEDSALKIKKVYPIGVGGFDPGVSSGSGGQTRLVTPTFQNATLRRENAQAARTYPSYYKGKPFMPITTVNGTTTAVAFHIEVNKSFIRGFDSHGCMRVREKDLHELYAILMNGGNPRMPVNVNLFTQDDSDHPANKINDSFQRVKNFGTKAQPQLRRDSHNLVIMEKVSGLPPIDLINRAGLQLFNPDLNPPLMQPET